MKKIILVTLSIFVLIIVVFLSSCIPKNINISYPAVQYNKDDPTIVKNLTIVMKGKLYNPLLLDSKYIGTCIIEGYDFTNDYELIDITFEQEIGNGLGSLDYTTNQNDDATEIVSIGKIWMSGNIDTLCIFGVTPENIGKIGSFEQVIISAPANTREEAIRITDAWRYD